MNKTQELNCMQRMQQLLRPETWMEMIVVAVSPTSWMGLAVMKDGSDRRFRGQGEMIIDERTVGDVRVA